MIDAGAFARLVRFKVPDRSPDRFDSVDELFVRFQIRHRGVDARAIEVRQVFAVGRTAREDALVWKVEMRAAKSLGAKPRIYRRFLHLFAQADEIYSAIRRIV